MKRGAVRRRRVRFRREVGRVGVGRMLDIVADGLVGW